jgi:hypothetical protein
MPRARGWHAAVTLLAFAPVLRADPPAKAPKGYERQTIEGFTLYVSQTVLDQKHDGFMRPPTRVLESELSDLRRILHPKIVRILQGIPIWVEWHKSDALSPGAVARYYGGPANELIKLGGDGKRANCVEILTLKTLASMRRPGTALQQVIVLHEMAHAVHHRLLGWDNPELEAIFKQAVDRKLYDEVNDRFGRRRKAYARTNAAEYFAEVSCAYLDSCNYYPFNFEQLRSHDPAAFKFVERVWKQPDRFATIAKPDDPFATAPAKERTEVASTPAAPRASVRMEMEAMTRLDEVRDLGRRGKKAEMKKGLEQLVRQFPTTEAADEARGLLKSMK